MMGRSRIWTDENIERAKRLWKTHTATEVGRMFDRSKNSVLGALYRDKVKNGYIPPPDSKYSKPHKNKYIFHINYTFSHRNYIY